MRRLLCYSSGLGLLVTYFGGAMGFVPPTSRLIPPGRAAVKPKLPLWSSMEGMGGGGGGGGGDMDSGVNSVQLIGRLGSEPQLKYLDSGSCVLSVSLAVRKEVMRNANTAGQMDGREEVDWIRLEAWGRTAELINQCAQKGSRLLVMGRLVSSSWTDKYGQTRSDIKVRVKRAEVLQSRRMEAANPELSYNNGWEEGGEMGGGMMEDEAPYAMPQQQRRQPPPQPQGGQQKRYQGQGGGKGGGGMQRGGARQQQQQPMTYSQEPAAPADLGFEIDDYPPF